MPVVIVTDDHHHHHHRSNGCLMLFGLAGLLGLGSCCVFGMFGALIDRASTGAGAVVVATEATGRGGAKTTHTTPATHARPTGTTPPTDPTSTLPAKPLAVADLTPALDGKAVRVRGRVTEADSATACTLDGTLSVTFASSPSPAVRKGQELTVEGTVFVVAGRVKLGRARVVE